MELTRKNIEEYINRFLAGETSNAEEQALYRFFRIGDVPGHLKEYAPMFAWYEGGMQEELESVVVEKPKSQKKRFKIPIIVWSAGIAAMVVVTLGVGILFFSEHSGGVQMEKWACYEGSYIEAGGKRVTDIKQILPLILEEQAEAERKEKLAEQRIREMEKKEEQVKEKEMMVN